MAARSPQYPLLWTENEGWYHPWGSDPIDQGLGQAANERTGTNTTPPTHPRTLPPTGFGSENPDRSASDVATAVSRWVARGGAMMNYYMYMGGQHFGRGAAAGVLNSYADGVNMHSDGTGGG